MPTLPTPPVPTTRTTSVWRMWLFNPFHFLAGGPALAWGLACIVLTASLGGAFDYRYTGVLSFQLATPTPIWLAITQGLAAWAVPSVLLYAGGRLLSRSPVRSRVRAIDVFGTQALARAPGLLMALIVVSPPFRDLTDALIYEGTSQFSIAQLTASRRDRHDDGIAAGLDRAPDVPRLCGFMQCRRWRGDRRVCRRDRPGRGRHGRVGSVFTGHLRLTACRQRVRPVRSAPSGRATGHADPPGPRTGPL